MKAGLVQLLAALGLLADASRVGVLLTCDEETGSVTSRPLIEHEARRSGAVLVCEPSTPTGASPVVGQVVPPPITEGARQDRGTATFRGLILVVDPSTGGAIWSYFMTR